MTQGREPVKRGQRPHFDLDKAKLRRLRLSAGLTVTELAGKVGCAKSNISMMENGTHGPSLATVHALCAVLNCVPQDLMADAPTTNGNGQDAA